MDNALTPEKITLTSQEDEKREEKGAETRTPQPPQRAVTDKERIAALEAVLDGTQVGGNHYKVKAIQPLTFSVSNHLSIMGHNAVKYVSRHQEKGGYRDLDKALHYILMERAYCYPDAPAIQVTFPE